MQGASIFTMGRWGVGLPYGFLECDLYCLVAKTNLSPACGYNGKNRRETHCSVLNMAPISRKPAQIAQNATSAHAQRSNLRKPFRAPLQIWRVVTISDCSGHCSAHRLPKTRGSPVVASFKLPWLPRTRPEGSAVTQRKGTGLLITIGNLGESNVIYSLGPEELTQL